jgi:hypothetical protein
MPTGSRIFQLGQFASYSALVSATTTATASVLSALTASLPANLQSSGAGTASLSANARL